MAYIAAHHSEYENRSVSGGDICFIYFRYKLPPQTPPLPPINLTKDMEVCDVGYLPVAVLSSLNHTTDQTLMIVLQSKSNKFI